MGVVGGHGKSVGHQRHDEKMTFFLNAPMEVKTGQPTRPAIHPPWIKIMILVCSRRIF